MPDQYKFEVAANQHPYFVGIAPMLSGLNFVSGIYLNAMGSSVFAVICDYGSHAFATALLLKCGAAVKI